MEIIATDTLARALWRSADDFPERTMVVGPSSGYSYRELAGVAGRVASVLRSSGVGRGDRVGIFLDKAPDALAVLYGVMRLGASYVPIDPDAPAARAARIVAGSGMKVVATTGAGATQIVAHLPADGPAPRFLLIDGDPPAGSASTPWSAVLEADPIDSDHPWPEAEDLAYILYTSGSTGEPKGVTLTHRAALAFVGWSAALLDLQPDDRLSQIAPWHFDLSTFDLFASMLVGATVVLAPKRVTLFPVNLAEFMAKEEISVWYSVPSALTKMLLHGGLAERRVPRLRHVVFAGEVFPSRYLRQVMAALPGRRFFNWYGPTETNVCTWYEVVDPPVDDTPIPIGRPLPGTVGLAIKDDGTAATIGEEGELYIAGPTVMSGYWGMPERSAASLGPHQNVLASVARGYRTGDWVRPMPSGDFQFVGRRDSMVKSRGYRIELGEVESALYSHPGVEEAAVVAIPDPEAGSLLHAAVVLRRDAKATAAELTRHCAERIPRYMVPAQVQVRDSLPYTLNGKIDRVTLARDLDPATVNAQPRNSP